jgi:hypothetical protein
VYSEFCLYQASSDEELDLSVEDADFRIDVFWSELAKKKQLLFPHLAEVAKVILLVPHSNAFCEGLFSIVRKVVTDQRSQLGRNKEGHSTDSQYSLALGVRNTLCGILGAKVNVFKGEKVCCYSWEPTPALLKKAKSATYEALNG